MTDKDKSPDATAHGTIGKKRYDFVEYNAKRGVKQTRLTDRQGCRRKSHIHIT